MRVCTFGSISESSVEIKVWYFRSWFSFQIVMSTACWNVCLPESLCRWQSLFPASLSDTAPWKAFQMSNNRSYIHVFKPAPLSPSKEEWLNSGWFLVLVWFVSFFFFFFDFPASFKKNIGVILHSQRLKSCCNVKNSGFFSGFPSHFADYGPVFMQVFFWMCGIKSMWCTEGISLNKWLSVSETEILKSASVFCIICCVYLSRSGL